MIQNKVNELIFREGGNNVHTFSIVLDNNETESAVIQTPCSLGELKKIFDEMLRKMNKGDAVQNEIQDRQNTQNTQDKDNQSVAAQGENLAQSLKKDEEALAAKDDRDTKK